MTKKLTQNQKLINNDITRFKNNKLSSNLTLLGLVFVCLYFLVMYSQNTGGYAQSDDGSWYFAEGTLAGSYVYNILTGVSVILNLGLLLVIFYASVKLKSYSKTYCYVVWVVAVIQIVRIFIYPVRTFNSYLASMSGTYKIFGAGVLVSLILFLVLSAACFVAAGVIGLIRALNRESYLKQLEAGEIDIEAAYKEEDVPEVVADAQVDEELKEEIKEENNEEAAEVSEDITGGNKDA